MKGSIRRFALLWCFLLLQTLALLACTSRKAVYIPPEWQTAPPPSGASQQPGQPARPSQPAQSRLQSPPPSSSGPLLKAPPTIKEKDLSEESEPPVEKKQPAPQPQYLASMHLVEKANGSLTQKKPDQAIPVLEEAIQVDVHNGEAFYSLAKAWRMKGSRQKALEFSKKAELLFQEDSRKLKEVYAFQAELYKEMGDSANREMCLKKAAKLGGTHK